MNIEVKTTKLTKSKIQQMDYIGIPKNSDVEVLGWVNMDKKRWVIVKNNNNYYRAEFITKLEKELKGCQFPSEKGGWEFPNVHYIKCITYNGSSFCYSPDRNDENNLNLYEHLIFFKTKTEIAGQIYY